MGDASGPVGVLEKGKHKEGGGVKVPAFASGLQAESGTKPGISAFLLGLPPPGVEILVA